MANRIDSEDEPRYWETVRYPDARGWFTVRWNDSLASQHLGFVPTLVQTNMSSSESWVIRGLHYQVGPNVQGKLVSVVHGSAFDVVVDLRRSSSGFGGWRAFELRAGQPHVLWVPPGFAHGFLALEPGTILQYDVTAPYDPSAERAVRWDDADLGIPWPIGSHEPLVSPKDAAAPAFADAEVFD